jgi:hypothetical protein
MHLPQLQIIVSVKRKLSLVLLNPAAGPLEVVALLHFPRHIGNGVGNLAQVRFRDNVE